MIRALCILGLSFGLSACSQAQTSEEASQSALTQLPIVEQERQTVQASATTESDLSQNIAKEQPPIQLTIARSAAGLSATYRLPTAQVEFAFEPYNAPSRMGNWLPSTEFTFDGKSVRRIDGGAFDAFTLSLTPEPRFTNRRYVAVDPIGDGHSLFLPAFASVNQPVYMSFDGFDEATVVRVAGRNASAGDLSLTVDPDFNRLIYIGPPAAIGASVIAGTEIPNWLKVKIDEDTQSLVYTLTQRFRRAPKAPPSVLVSNRNDFESRGWKGGALEDGVIALRFRGMELTQSDQELSRSITGLIGHETTHLWVGQLFPNLQNAEQSWAHEGTAEYIAARLHLSGDDFTQFAEETYNRCLINLGASALNDPADMKQGAEAYDCGFIVNLFAELAAHKSSGADILDIWNSVFTNAQPKGYQPENFLAIAKSLGGRSFELAAQPFFIPDGQSAAPAITADQRIASLAALGITAALRDPADLPTREINQRWLMPILASLCSSGFGYHDDGDFYRLDTKNNCGEAIAGDPSVNQVGPYNFIDEPYAAYQYARALCQAQAPLTLTRIDGSPLPAINCTAKIEGDIQAGLDFIAFPELPSLKR